jgi:hypothetical protein
MTIFGAILSAMVSRIRACSGDANYKLSRGGLVGSVKDGLQLPLHVECGLLRRLGERFSFQGLNRRWIRLIN